MSSSSDTKIDLSILEDNMEEPSQDCDDIKTCPAVNRLLSALRYYSSLKIDENENHRDIFINFMNEVYTPSMIIDDSYHLRRIHSQSTQELIDFAMNECGFSKCNINTCDFANRHYRVGHYDTYNTKQLKTSDPKVTVFRDLMDSNHYCLFHLIETGLRCVDNGNQNDVFDEKEEIQYKESYDPEFAKMRRIISSTRDTSDRFNRISSSNKYNIDTTTDQGSTDESNGITYLDVIFEYLQDIKIPDPTIEKLYYYLQQEAFETESMDIDLTITNGNIVAHMMNQDGCMDAVISLFAESRGMCCIYYSNILHTLRLGCDCIVFCFSIFGYI